MRDEGAGANHQPAPILEPQAAADGALESLDRWQAIPHADRDAMIQGAHAIAQRELMDRDVTDYGEICALLVRAMVRGYEMGRA